MQSVIFSWQYSLKLSKTDSQSVLKYQPNVIAFRRIIQFTIIAKNLWFYQQTTNWIQREGGRGIDFNAMKHMSWNIQGGCWQLAGHVKVNRTWMMYIFGLKAWCMVIAKVSACLDKNVRFPPEHNYHSLLKSIETQQFMANLYITLCSSGLSSLRPSVWSPIPS